MVTAVGVLLLLSLGSVLWIVSPQKPRRPEAGPGGTEPGAAIRAIGREVPQAPVQARLFVDSDPSGAQVYAGPRRLGETPLPIDLPGDALEVTLSYAGRPDLSYIIRRRDGPKLMLRLPAGSSTSAEPRGPHRDHHHRDHGKEVDPGKPTIADPSARPGTPTPIAPTPATSPGPVQTDPATARPTPARPGDKKPLKVKVLGDEDEDHPRAIKPID